MKADIVEENEKIHDCFVSEIKLAPARRKFWISWSEKFLVEDLNEQNLVFDSYIPKGVTKYTWPHSSTHSDVEYLADDISCVIGF